MGMRRPCSTVMSGGVPAAMAALSWVVPGHSATMVSTWTSGFCSFHILVNVVMMPHSPVMPLRSMESPYSSWQSPKKRMTVSVMGSWALVRPPRVSEVRKTSVRMSDLLRTIVLLVSIRFYGMQVTADGASLPLLAEFN